MEAVNLSLPFSVLYTIGHNYVPVEFVTMVNIILCIGIAISYMHRKILGFYFRRKSN